MFSGISKMFNKKEEDSSPTNSKEEGEQKKIEEADEVLAEDNRSFMLQMISQNGLKTGMDLSKVTLPTFILEPRSLLDKLSDVIIHPEIFSKLHQPEDPVERMVGVVRWYFSAYHVRPKGSKKPFNPVLGETYRCNVKDSDGTSDTAVSWVAQQVSHHPPVSAFFSRSKDGNVALQGTFAPKSKFLGNSAASIGGGGFRLLMPSRDNEVYYINWPTVYVRGIMFGTLLMEIGGPVQILCPQTGLQADIEFVPKPWFGGAYHTVKGTIKKGESTALYTLAGSWTSKMTMTDSNTKEEKVLFDKNSEPQGSAMVQPPFDDEEEAKKGEHIRAWSSVEIWEKTAEAVRTNDQKAATANKTSVEEYQRKIRAERTEKSISYVPSLFKKGAAEGEWVYTGESAIDFPAIPQ